MRWQRSARFNGCQLASVGDNDVGRRQWEAACVGAWESPPGVGVNNGNCSSSDGSDLQMLLAALFIIVIIKCCQCVILAVDL